MVKNNYYIDELKKFAGAKVKIEKTNGTNTIEGIIKGINFNDPSNFILMTDKEKILVTPEFCIIRRRKFDNERSKL